MRRRLFLMGVAGAAGCSRARERRLYVYNWSFYIAKETVPRFERETGVEVRYRTFESAEEMLAKVSAGNSGWDIVIPSNAFVAPMREQGLLAPLDHARLPNLGNLEDRFRDPAWDPGLGYSIPYMYGATGILYNRSVRPEPRGWADFWQDRYGRRVTMMDDPSEVFAAALKRAGHSVNSDAAGEIDEAKRDLIAAKPLLRAFISADVRDQVVAGDVLMAQIWAQMGRLAVNERRDLGFAYPAEGFALYCDNVVILRESREPELAHRFLDYLLRPDVSAEIAQAVTTATPNAAARRLLPVEAREDPILYPPPDVAARGEWYRSLPAAGQRLRDRAWTEIKSS
ncbi:MAG: spermidine/putrescine ABC transporter substrate-binding protein [Acidobacteria bacterium]|nr:spermidine/putrescine ABC transporter substrate-binding protein [Acidobacteriota bacterium]